MRRTRTDILLNALNAKRGLKYPQVGYYYFADIRGDGCNVKSVYQIVNGHRGVSYAGELNAASNADRCRRIQAAIDAA